MSHRKNLSSWAKADELSRVDRPELRGPSARQIPDRGGVRSVQLRILYSDAMMDWFYGIVQRV